MFFSLLNIQDRFCILVFMTIPCFLFSQIDSTHYLENKELESSVDSMINLLYKSKSDVYKEFASFLDSINNEMGVFKTGNKIEFEKFKKENDSIFLKFIKESWQSFHTFFYQQPTSVKPINPPIYLDDGKSGIEIVQPLETILYIDSTEIKEPLIKPIFEEEPIKTMKAAPYKKNFDFYGKPLSISYYPEDLPILDFVSEGTIFEFCKGLSSLSHLKNLIAKLLVYSIKLELNEWGILSMIRYASETMFEDKNEQVLFVMYALSIYDFDMRIGMDAMDVYLLIAASQPIYNTYLINDTVQRKSYYWIPFKKDRSRLPDVIMVAYDSTANNKISLKIVKTPLIGQTITSRSVKFNDERITVNVYKEYIDFLNDIPDCDLIVNVGAPLSDIVLKSLDDFFIPNFKNKNDFERIELLLDFCHTLPYEIDSLQFGRENYLFPDETLYYPFSDCEDKAVLFVRLVERYTGLKSIVLKYPRHISVAIALNEFTTKDFDCITFNGSKYCICDPTYKLSPIGSLPPEFDLIQPDKLIFFN
jgi:hypothetical protein